MTGMYYHIQVSLVETRSSEAASRELGFSELFAWAGLKHDPSDLYFSKSYIYKSRSERVRLRMYHSG
jgi:hypothetical protein